MPKSLAVGNGNILVCLDENAQVRDFFFPHVGEENHLGGHRKHRIGAWIDGDLRWFSDESWSISVNCMTTSLVGDITAYNDELGISIHLKDVVYNEKNVFVRNVSVTNMNDTEKTIKIFFNQEFELYESHTAHTAYYDPFQGAIIHYRGRRVFLVDAMDEDNNEFDMYTTGVSGIDGKAGSYKDAEDGELASNPIEHGPADSVLGMTIECDPREEKQIYYWMVVGKSIEEVTDINKETKAKGLAHITKSTEDFWYAWLHRRNFSFDTLSKEAESLFRKSLLLMRSHVDSGGAIIASGDYDIPQHGKDTYGYMWPRDGALCAVTLDKAGDSKIANRFFQFCSDVIAKRGYFMHKYSPDKSLGSSWHPWVYRGEPQLPIQEDETALVLYGLWEHYLRSKDIEFVEEMYNQLIKRAADFLVEFRHEKTDLPHPSYDLWEEKRGIHTFTCGAVYGALTAAANFADLLGKTDAGMRYRYAAETIREATLKHLYDKERGIFLKRLYEDESGNLQPDNTLDISSLYGMFAFDILDIEDSRLESMADAVEDRLILDTKIGGCVRYEGDEYYRVDDDLPGNPWNIATLWFAQYKMKKAQDEEEILSTQKWLHWVLSYAKNSGILSEQVHPHTGEQLSAAPLTWSHAEYIRTVLLYLNRLEELELCELCNPIE